MPAYTKESCDNDEGEDDDNNKNNNRTYRNLENK
jgi:hypothetical protein